MANDNVILNAMVSQAEDILCAALAPGVANFAIASCNIIFVEILKSASSHRNHNAIPAILIVHAANVVYVASSLPSVNYLDKCVNVSNALLVHSSLSNLRSVDGLLVDSYIEAISVEAMKSYISVFSKFFISASMDEKKTFIDSVNATLDCNMFPDIYTAISRVISDYPIKAILNQYSMRFSVLQ